MMEFRKEADLMAATSKLDEEQSMVSKLQKQIKDLESRWALLFAKLWSWGLQNNGFFFEAQQ